MNATTTPPDDTLVTPTSTISTINGPAQVGNGSTTTTTPGQLEVCIEIYPGVGQTEYGLQPCDWYAGVATAPPPIPPTTELPLTGGSSVLLFAAIAMTAAGGAVVRLVRRTP